jgi:hypothetical protein
MEKISPPVKKEKEKDELVCREYQTLKCRKIKG